MSKTYCFDIDNTICITDGTEYKNSKPLINRIEQVNSLKREGNKVILYTARGFVSGIDFYKLTFEQLKTWGVEFDELYMGKPDADFYIDDKNKDIFEWF